MQAWRKHTKFAKSKHFNRHEIVLLREFNTRRQIFESWFNAAMKRAPISLFCNKVQKACRTVERRIAFQKMLEVAVYDQELDAFVDVIHKQTMLKRKAQFFALLKRDLVASKKAMQIAQRRD